MKLRTPLLAGSAALVLTLGAAVPATASVTPDFERVALSEPGTMIPPGTNTAKQKDLVLTIDGPARLTGASYRFYSDGVADIAVVQKNAGVSSITNPPTLNAGNGGMALDPAAPNRATITIYQTTAPGKYRITQPVTMHSFDSATSVSVVQTRTTTPRYLTIRANTAYSKRQSWVAGSGYVPASRKVKVYAPDYQTGAKVTIYAKKRGQSGYHRASDTLRLRKLANSYSSKATLRLARKYDTRGTKFYVKIRSVPFASGYKTRVYRVL